MPDLSGAKEKSDNSFIFVGIYIRRIDHRQYERDNDTKNLHLEYYLRAMQLYRTKFKTENKQHMLIFVLLSDDIQ